MGVRSLARARRSAARDAPDDPAEVERVVYEQIYRYPRRYVENVRPLEREGSDAAPDDDE